MNLLMPKNIKGKREFCFIWVFLVIFKLLLFPIKINASDSESAVIGPLYVLGEIPATEQKILFNRFREQINQHYSLVSYKVLEMISEQENALDLEKCKSRDCVLKVKNFINRIRWQFKTDDLFLFGLVRSESDTQLSLKISSLLAPEITQIIVTRTCYGCEIKVLIDEVDKLVQKMLQKISKQKNLFSLEKNTSADEISSEATDKKSFSADDIPSDEISSEATDKKSFSADDIPSRPTDEKVDEKNTSADDIPSPEIDEKFSQAPESPPTDLYTLARDAYNQKIGKLLVNVTYSLQVFRSGMYVKLEVSIDQQGNVMNQKIIKSSGSKDFDKTAILNVQEIQFDPLPEVMKKFGNYVVILQIQNSR